VFDLMEPLRPIVDRAVLAFVQSHTFHPADFTIRTDGVCRLNPEMAKAIVQLVSKAIGDPGAWVRILLGPHLLEKSC
jgi:CRISPR/Cas system-associated endonuclease Cas1